MEHGPIEEMPTRFNVRAGVAVFKLFVVAHDGTFPLWNSVQAKVLTPKRKNNRSHKKYNTWRVNTGRHLHIATSTHMICPPFVLGIHAASEEIHGGYDEAKVGRIIQAVVCAGPQLKKKTISRQPVINRETPLKPRLHL